MNHLYVYNCTKISTILIQVTLLQVITHFSNATSYTHLQLMLFLSIVIKSIARLIFQNMRQQTVALEQAALILNAIMIIMSQLSFVMIIRLSLLMFINVMTTLFYPFYKAFQNVIRHKIISPIPLGNSQY